jgi:antitoxin VapB
MALSIRNPKAEQLAREIAAISGENMTLATITALEERLQRLRGRRMAPDIAQEIKSIAQRCRKLPDLDQRLPDQILGYEEDGII